jgi:hypothetical protein
LSLAVAVCGFASNARAREVELQVEGGALIGRGIPEMSPRPTIRGDISIWWTPHPAFNLGFSTGVGVTVLPYGCTDVIPGIGERGHAGCGDGLRDNFTLLPRLMLGLRVLVGPRAAVGASFGTTFIMAEGVNDYFLYPYPTAGVFAEISIGPADRVSLRAGFWYVDIAYRDSRGFLAPTLALSWK